MGKVEMLLKKRIRTVEMIEESGKQQMMYDIIVAGLPTAREVYEIVYPNGLIANVFQIGDVRRVSFTQIKKDLDKIMVGLG